MFTKSLSVHLSVLIISIYIQCLGQALFFFDFCVYTNCSGVLSLYEIISIFFIEYHQAEEFEDHQHAVRERLMGAQERCQNLNACARDCDLESLEQFVTSMILEMRIDSGTNHDS